jgi:hypothetical protein
MPIIKQNWDEDATILSTLMGRRIVDIDYDGTYSAPITLKLDDGRRITIDAIGDNAYTKITDK